MKEILPRRGFLRGLAALPLIGGGVTLIGSPTKADVPVTSELMVTYRQFLVGELHRIWTEEFRGSPPLENTIWLPSGNPGEAFHLSADRKTWKPSPPSNRAAVVLAAVGCDWRKDGGDR